MSRGNNGQKIFLADKGRRLFLSTLGEACEQMGWIIHSYVLMSNHYHLLMETPEPNLSVGMRWFQGAYTQRFNAMFQRKGHLYQGRYKAVPVQTDPRDGGLEYFRAVSTYIHLNPFRAKLAGEGFEEPLDSYLWSSYPAYIPKEKQGPHWLETSKTYRSFGLDPQNENTPRSYEHHLLRKMKFEGDPDAGRRGEFEELNAKKWYVGSEAFLKRLSEQLSQAEKGDNYRGEQRQEHTQEAAKRSLEQCLNVLDLTEEELKNLKPVDPRKQLIAWKLKTTTSVTGVWICKQIDMGHRSNLSRALKKIRETKDEDLMKLKEKVIQCTG